MISPLFTNEVPIDFEKKALNDFRILDAAPFSYNKKYNHYLSSSDLKNLNFSKGTFIFRDQDGNIKTEPYEGPVFNMSKLRAVPMPTGPDFDAKDDSEYDLFDIEDFVKSEIDKRICENRTYDSVNHPKHYTDGSIECIDAMQAAFGDDELKIYCKIAAFKYLWRSEKKGHEYQDISKAKWYIDKWLDLSSEDAL